MNFGGNMSEDVTKKREIKGHNVYVTKLFGDGEEGQYHVVIGRNGEQEGKPHTGDRTSSEKYIVEKVNRS